jgi:hypothetical protein
MKGSRFGFRRAVACIDVRINAITRAGSVGFLLLVLGITPACSKQWAPHPYVQATRAEGSWVIRSGQDLPSGPDSRHLILRLDKVNASGDGRFYPGQAIAEGVVKWADSEQPMRMEYCTEKNPGLPVVWVRYEMYGDAQTGPAGASDGFGIQLWIPETDMIGSGPDIEGDTLYVKFGDEQLAAGSSWLEGAVEYVRDR